MLVTIKKIVDRLHYAKMQLGILTCVFSVLALLPNVGQALPFSEISQVYFFGDSLTDSGFNNNITALNGIPNKAPTFTTFGGYTWAQYVANDIKGFPLPVGPFPTIHDLITNNTTPTNPTPVPYVTPDLTGVDYACGGSKTNSIPGFDILWAPSLQQQISHFLATSPQQLDPKALYFIWSGANDILAALTQVPFPTPTQLYQTADTATTNIANVVAQLSARGARRIVVLSLPNVSSTPFVAALTQASNDSSIVPLTKNLSFIFNSMLNQKLGDVIKRYGVRVLYFDTYSALDIMIANTKAGIPTVVSGVFFYFVNYNIPVCGTVSALFCPNTSEGHIFADSVHPTDMAHRALSLEVERQIRLWP